MYRIHYLYDLQQEQDVLGTLQRFVVIGGSSIILITFLFVFFLIYARRKQNRLFLLNKTIRKEFETQLLQSQIETQEETFSVLGKELHDNVGQLLNSSKLIIGVARRQPNAPTDILSMANDTLSKAINEIRTLSKSLDKEWLKQFNLIENIQTEVNRLNVTDELIIQFDHIGFVQLKSEKQIILFRIVQEALQNAIKHSRATNIRIGIEETDSAIELFIADNGIGFIGSDSTDKGSGLQNMKYRTSLIGGKIEWRSVLNGGTKVIINLPVKIDVL